ncbi:MAG TPA: hypothetical protein VF663_16555 [Telluria sp.]
MPAAAGLFEQMTHLFASHSPRSKLKIVPRQLDASFQALEAAPSDEVAAVRKVLEEMTERMNAMVDARANDARQAEERAAAQESLKVGSMLAKARARAAEPFPPSTDESKNAAYMAGMRRDAAAALQGRIDRNELLAPRQFQEALGISKQSINEAIKARRMFALMGPAGEFYYPAFYADGMFDRRSLEKVTKALGDVPAASKYFFFTSTSTLLGNATPLEALAKGRLDDVVTAAIAFTER